MNRHEFDRLEIEANGITTPSVGSHHLHIPRGYDVRKLMDIVRKETLDQFEPWQNLWVYPFDEYFPKID